MEEKKVPESIDAYIALFPPEKQALLVELRRVIREAAPEATEAIRYQMPTFVFHGNLVHFAQFANHIGFFPAPSGIEAFLEKTALYRTGKGTLRFLADKPLPFSLIADITRFRVEENKKLAEEKRRKK